MEPLRGILSDVLIYLLENKLIDGAITLKNGGPKPWLAEPIIAQTKRKFFNVLKVSLCTRKCLLIQF